MRQQMGWDDLKVFLALMRVGSVRAAAIQLGISHSTVARRIDTLEQKLAVRLFDRLATGYVLTSVGEDMLEVAEQVENELGGLERRILGRDLQLAGRIHVTMVDALAIKLLMPHLSEFSHKYPDIDLELDVTYEAANLDNREADVALRFAQNPPDHLIGRRLLTFATATYASEHYINSHDLQDPKSAQWIGFQSQKTLPEWVRKSDFPTLPVKGKYSNLLVQLEACKAGMGLGMLPCFLCDNEPSLRQLSPPIINKNFELWLLMHRDIRPNSRIRVFTDFIAAAIKGHRTLIEGHENPTRSCGG